MSQDSHSPLSAAWPAGFLSVDMDGLWAIRQCYDQPAENSFERDAVWEEGARWLLEAFERRGLRATFFLVARDLEVDSKRALAAEIRARGHEIANHSLNHRIGLTLLPMGRLLDELAAAQALFEKRLGFRPAGFRAPGYDVDARLLRALRRAGFAYDASLLPTWWAPALRLASALAARRIAGGRRQFGRVSYGLAPLWPYIPDPYHLRRERSMPPDRGAAFWEFPIGVTPRLRLPIGAGYAMTAGPEYLRRALASLRREGLPVSFLIHGADATDLRSPANAIFPRRAAPPSIAGFAMSGREKQRRLSALLDLLADALEFSTYEQWLNRRGIPCAAPG